MMGKQGGLTVPRWRIYVLVVRARAGDSQAAEQMLRLAVDGDERAQSAVMRSLTGGRLPELSGTGCSGLDGYEEELLHLKDLSNAKPGEALSEVYRALEHTDRGTCYQIQVLATLAKIFRSLGRLEAAADVLEGALAAGAGCPASVLDVQRRQANLLGYAGHLSEAVAQLDAVVEGYRRLRGPGHDRDGNGVAACQFDRGNILGYSGDWESAAADFGACLKSIGPKARSSLFDTAVFNLATCFSRLDEDRQREAFTMLPGIRRRFQGVSERSVPRARIDWLEGQLRWKLRKGKPSRARGRLTDALDVFIARCLRDEATAVAVDIVLIHGHDTDGIKAFLGQKAEALKSILLRRTVIRRLEELEAVVRPTDVLLDKLERATRKLREAVKGRSGVIPSLVG